MTKPAAPTVLEVIQDLRSAVMERAVWIEIANFLEQYVESEFRQHRAIQTSVGVVSPGIPLKILQQINDNIDRLNRQADQLGKESHEDKTEKPAPKKKPGRRLVKKGLPAN